MVTLSGDVVAVGVRANKFQLVYETVAQMLAATDTIADGELVQAAHYFYEGAGSASDQDVTNAGGSKLYCIGNPYVTPDQFGAPGQGSDETAFVNAAIASNKPVFLNRYYDVTNVVFPADRNGITLIGAGSAVSGLKGTSVSSEAILQTFAVGSSADSKGHYIANFGIIGDGKRAFGICQIINSHIECVHLATAANQSPNAFRGVDGYVIELCFGNTLRNMESSGLLTGSDMKINATVLDCIVDMFYANNANADYHIDIDQTRQEIAEQTANGHGVITFNTPTLQGARGYGVKIAGTYAANFHNMYMENCVGSILVLDIDQVNFHGCDITNNSTAHGVWLDQTKGAATYSANFSGCQFTNPVVCGNVRSVNFFGCYGADAEIANILKTNASFKTQDAASTNGTGALQVSTFGEYKNAGGSVIGMKCSDSGNYTRLSVNNAGTISAETPFALTNVDHLPHKPVVWWAGGNPSWTSGVAITPITSGAVGGSGSLTFSVVGDKKIAGVLPTGVSINSSTGEITGTPTQTGTFRLKVRATDANGSYDDSRILTATVT